MHTAGKYCVHVSSFSTRVAETFRRHCIFSIFPHPYSLPVSRHPFVASSFCHLSIHQPRTEFISRIHLANFQPSSPDPFLESRNFLFLRHLQLFFYRVTFAGREIQISRILAAITGSSRLIGNDRKISSQLRFVRGSRSEQ